MVQYAPRARRHLDAIAEYLAERNPRAVSRVAERIQDTARLLETFPYAGHPGALPGTREVNVRGFPYIIVYHVAGDDDRVTVIGIYHGAQRRPGQ